MMLLLPKQPEQSRWQRELNLMSALYHVFQHQNKCVMHNYIVWSSLPLSTVVLNSRDQQGNYGLMFKPIWHILSKVACIDVQTHL